MAGEVDAEGCPLRDSGVDCRGRFSPLFGEALPFPVVFVRTGGIIEEYNHSFHTQIVGLERAAVLGHTWHELPARVRDRLAPLFSDLPVAPSRSPLELRVDCCDGVTRDFLVHRNAVGRADAPVGSLLCLLDVTDVRHYAEALRESAQQYRTLAENSPDWITRFDRELRIAYVNRAVEPVLGCGVAELVGKRNGELGLHGLVTKRWDEEIAEVFETGRAQRRRVELETSCGSFVFDRSLSAERDAGGTVRFVLSVARDITEVVETERALRDSEHSFRRLFEFSNDAILLLDERMSVIDANGRAAEWLATRKREVFDRSFVHFVVPGERELSRRALERVPREGAVRFETWLRRDDGSRLPVDVSARLVDMERGTVQVVLRDMSQHKEAEAEILAQRRSFTSIVEKSVEGILVADRDTIYYANPTARRWLESPHAQPLRRSLEQLLGGAPRQTIELGGPPSDEGLCVLELQATATLWQDQQASLVTLRDITEHHQAKAALRQAHIELESRVNERTEALRASNEQLRLEVVERRRIERELRKLSSAVEHSSSMVMITDTELFIEYVNPKFCQVSGYGPEDLLGRTPRLLRADAGSTSLYDVMRRTVLSGNPWHGELCALRKDDSRFWQLASLAPVRHPSGRTTHFVFVAEDISERIHHEQELLEAKERAEAASRAKSHFLAGMSHELRTPLNAVIGFSQVLAEQFFGELNPKQAEYVQDILSSGRHLLALINDILDLAKIEADKLALSLHPLHLPDVLESSLVMVRERARAHRIELTIELPPELASLSLVADERRLKQVLYNLLSNAVKFTPDGGIVRVSARLEREALSVSVTDSGIGIPDELLDRVFEPFYQVQSNVLGKTPGTGLGLSISRAIIEMHGGRLWAERVAPQGSCFCFRLPLDNAAQPPPALLASVRPEQSRTPLPESSREFGAARAGVEAVAHRGDGQDSPRGAETTAADPPLTVATPDRASS